MIDTESQFKLLKGTDESLKHVCHEVSDSFFGNTDFIQYMNNLYKFMRNKEGIGLAAPQIGDSRNIFTMEVYGIKRLCINPKIVKMCDKMTVTKEGCLSYPGLFLYIKRPTSVSVEYNNPDGDIITITLDGLESVCFQHEYDHLNGIMFTKRVGNTALKLAKQKQKKLLKKGKI